MAILTNLPQLVSGSAQSSEDDGTLLSVTTTWQAKVTATGQILTVTNVYAGEDWHGGGQSAWDLIFAAVADSFKAIAGGDAMTANPVDVT